MNKKSLFLFCLILVLCHGHSSANPKIEPCVAGRTSAQSGFWKWPARSRIRVYLRVPDFSEADGEPVELALKNWDAAAGENGSDVHFVFGVNKSNGIEGPTSCDSQAVLGGYQDSRMRLAQVGNR